MLIIFLKTNKCVEQYYKDGEPLLVFAFIMLILDTCNKTILLCTHLCII